MNALPSAGVLLLLEAVLTERAKSKGPELALVWTGPDGDGSTARDTWVVFRELLAEAKESVLIAGFRFDHGVELFQALHAGMRDRGVVTQIFVDAPSGRPDVPESEHVKRFIETFVISNWPFSVPHPEFYYDPRTVKPQSRASLHAKCVVIDQKKALVGSANFTQRGQSRNIEMGVLLNDEAFAQEIFGHWQGLIRSGLVSRC